MSDKSPETEEREELPLADAVKHLLEECRMVLPGIQALFGFQLIAVFNQGFDKKLSLTEQILHLCAIVLVALAVALVMTPASYHRQTCPREVTAKFLKLATQLLLWGMLPLALGTALDFYLICQIILHKPAISAVLSGLLLTAFLSLWFGLPRLMPDPREP